MPANRLTDLHHRHKQGAESLQEKGLIEIDNPLRSPKTCHYAERDFKPLLIIVPYGYGITMGNGRISKHLVPAPRSCLLMDVGRLDLLIVV
jgi:hypothetical protein